MISLLLSALFVGRFFADSYLNQKLLTDTKYIFDNADSVGEALSVLEKDNPDIKGRIVISGAQIDNAVCQSDSESFYQSHNQLKKKSRYGSLFLAKNDSFERTDGDQNIVIFGNNMSDGTMFGSLKKYLNLSFYKSNPLINIYYGNNKTEDYAIMAVMLIADSVAANGNYSVAKSHFVGEGDFQKWYSQTNERSIISTKITAEYTDEFLTLITPTDHFDGARLAIVAKKITPWEAERIDVATAKTNPETKYPKAWYDKKGLEYPY